MYSEYFRRFVMRHRGVRECSVRVCPSTEVENEKCMADLCCADVNGNVKVEDHRMEYCIMQGE